MGLLAQLFTWWNGQTVATRLHTALRGKPVGRDAQGNSFYQSGDGKRRWVIFNGESEASRIPPEWHGWLHHTWQEPPSEIAVPRKSWEQPHVPNLTGSVLAYRPPGSLLSPEPTVRRDYEAWVPE